MNGSKIIYTKMTKKAINLMFEKHKNQVDQGGCPYPFHPLIVAIGMPDEDTTCAALLHDICEDTDLDIDDLRKLGFNEKVCEAVSLLTRDKNISYCEYIDNLSNNRIAVTVKLSDINHNMNLDRLDYVRDKDYKRLEKYEQCKKRLEEKLKCFESE